MAETRVVHIRDRVLGSVYIGRANHRVQVGESIFRNPFVIGKNGSRNQVLRSYEWWINERRDLWWSLPDLRGKPLACWCRHDGEALNANNRCHGDILIDLLERYSDEELIAAARQARAQGEGE